MKTLAHIAHIALFSLVSLFGLAPVTSNAGPADSCHFHGSKLQFLLPVAKVLAIFAA